MKNTLTTIASVAILAISANAQTITSATGVDLTQVGDLLSGTTTDLSQDAHEQNQHVAFYEGITTLGSALATNSGSIAAGVQVASTYFHFDPTGTTGSADNSGSITFGNNVLGIIWSNGFNGGGALLNDSDAVVGVAGVTQTTALSRGTLENVSDGFLTFSGNQVDFSELSSSASATDSFRVITAVPEPSSTALLGLGALGLLARRKR